MDLFNLELSDAEQRQLAEMRDEVNIARALLHHRLEGGLSQAEVARLANTTQARVSEIEAMKGDPRLSTLGRVARALGCMIDMVPITVAAPTPTPLGYNPVRSVDSTTTARGGGVGWSPFDTSILPAWERASHG